MRIAVLGEHRFKTIGPGRGGTHVVDQLATQNKKLAGTFVPMRLKSCPGIHVHIERPLPRFFADPENFELGTATHIQPRQLVNVGEQVACRCRDNGCIHEIRLKIYRVA